MNTSRIQLEIALVSAPAPRPVPARFRRTARSRWWFAQMRRAVDEAGKEVALEPCGTEQPPPRQVGLAPDKPGAGPAPGQSSLLIDAA